MSEQPFVTFGAPQITSAEIDEVTACLASGWLGTGPRVAQFEAAFADYKQLSSDQLAAVNSCTAALHLALLTANLPAGSEVITTPLTFCATVNAILHAGLTPVLADIDPTTYNLSPATIEAAINSRTRAILPVHFAGRPCDMQAIQGIANKHHLVIIEDCAHAVEGQYQGQPLGTLGDFGCFSFYVTKNLTTGEGGMLIGKDTTAIARARTLALHGLSQDAWQRYSDTGYQHYQVIEAGFKYNMMDLQAAIGIHQLQRLEANWQRRQAIWQRYQQAFASLPVTLPAQPAAGNRHAYHLFTLLIDEAQCGISRDQFMQAMHQQGIGTGVHYQSIPEHPYYQQRFGWQPANCPHAQRVGQTTVSIPLSAALAQADVGRIIDAVIQLFS